MTTPLGRALARQLILNQNAANDVVDAAPPPPPSGAGGTVTVNGRKYAESLDIKWDSPQKFVSVPLIDDSGQPANGKGTVPPECRKCGTSYSSWEISLANETGGGVAFKNSRNWDDDDDCSTCASTITDGPSCAQDSAVEKSRRADPHHGDGSVDVAARHQPERGTWKNPIEFFLTCLGYTVGLGAIWRFPYLCYANGGGAFLIPYLITSVFVGVPLYGLELCIGQYASLGPNKVFVKMAPLFQGLGYAVLVVAGLTSIYYNIIVAWAIFYFFASFSKELPWKFCGKDYNSPACFSWFQDDECRGRNQSLTFWNNTCTTASEVCRNSLNLCAGSNGRSVDPRSTSCNRTLQAPWNATHCLNVTAVEANESYLYVPLKHAYGRISSSEEFFSKYMLAKTDGWDDFGGLKWDLALCSLLAWILVAASLCKGVKSSGKVVYFTSLFPYVVLLIFGIKGATLPGATEGFMFFAKPKWEALLRPQVWIEAASQNFYALGSAFGGLISFSSYNKFNHNCLRDAIFIGLADFGTAFFSGSVVFAILGYTAHELGVPVGEVVQSDVGLTFIAYPEAVSKLPWSQMWGVLFFAMMVACGMDSEFTMVETLLTALFDEFPNLRRHKAKVAIVASLIGYAIGLSMCARGGIYLFNLFNYYSAGWSVLILGLLEAFVVVYVYGYQKFMHNVKQMIPKIVPTEFYWRWTWSITVPVIIVAILTFTFIHYEPPSFEGKPFPAWADGIGWTMGLAPLVVLVFMGSRRVVIAAGRPGSVWAQVMKPKPGWGPADPLLAAATPEHDGGLHGERNLAVDEFEPRYVSKVDDDEFVSTLRIPRPSVDYGTSPSALV